MPCLWFSASFPKSVSQHSTSSKHLNCKVYSLTITALINNYKSLRHTTIAFILLMLMQFIRDSANPSWACLGFSQKRVQFGNVHMSLIFLESVGWLGHILMVRSEGKKWAETCNACFCLGLIRMLPSHPFSIDQCTFHVSTRSQEVRK